MSLTLSVTSVAAWADSTPSSPQYNYLLHCGGCHIEDGSGMKDVVPDLNEHMGFFASTAEGRSYLVRVPGSAHSPLKDDELAEVLNWMLSTFASDSAPELYTEEEVTANRRIPMHDSPAVRKELLKHIEETQSPTQPDPADVSDTESYSNQLTANRHESFGAALFFDTSLSRYNNLSCASCHDPAKAFSDARPTSVLAGASSGSDGVSVGQRNAPALTYVGFTPDLTLNDSHTVISGSTLRGAPDPVPADKVRGGFFWDGREATLESQVLEPFTNKSEMALADEYELTTRVINNEAYRQYLGDSLDHNDVLPKISSALAAFLRSDTFNSFDSRYDRYLRGEIKPTREETIGMGLFFAPGFTSCANCHQSEATGYAQREVFTNHRYENIGTPINSVLLDQNGSDKTFRDLGLASNPAVTNEFELTDLAGRIKVPSLRNVAVTGPYMHNGVFSELSTLMVFYNHFNETGHSGQLNPETNKPWGISNSPENVVEHKLQSGFPLNARQIAALTAFLRMLTDERYEHLL